MRDGWKWRLSHESLSNRVMHSDVFKAEEDWTKSQQNDWLLGLQVYTLYMKIMYQYLPGGGAILEPVHC